jgi:hypothetical protein
MINYRELMKEYDVKLDNPVLDPAFVSKANDFEKKLEANELTEEEIKAWDAELVELFKKHDLTEEESPEVIAARRNQAIAEAKAAIAEAETVDQLKALHGSLSEFPEVLPLITKKIEKLEADAKKQSDQAAAQIRAKLITDASAEIKAAKYEELQALGEKYKEYAELVKLINERHSNEKPVKDTEQLKEKLLSKKEWSYAELKAMNIEPTGNDMTIAGVKLEKEMYFRVYSVRR